MCIAISKKPYTKSSAGIVKMRQPVLCPGWYQTIWSVMEAASLWMKGFSQNERPVRTPLEITNGTNKTKKANHKSAMNGLALRCAHTSHARVNSDVKEM